MQIVHHRRVPLVKHPVDSLGSLMRLLMRVAVDIDKGVLRPVRRRLARKRVAISLTLQVAVEPVDHLVTAIRI